MKITDIKTIGLEFPFNHRGGPKASGGRGWKVLSTVLVKVTTSSNDQDIYRQAAVWVRENMPEVMEGPCKNRGTMEGTPVECSRAMTAGYKAFVASPDFPGVPPLPEGAQ